MENNQTYPLVEWLFFAVPRFVIVVFPDHTHYLFLIL